ncbi:acyltransferase family protein [Hymenobacter terrenus]|uniref:acyltransferase family protein n=1 Tax=Hymenobacter terrenus TaxID=1629124 RepID=UPI000619C9CE|nr:acyltransferase [Hymenobacter terrenus]
MSANIPPIAYRPTLNGVRAIAVWLVVFGHWARLPFPVGEMGRITFFVLSGYLISGIIWKQRVHSGASGPWWSRLRTFYQRRILRTLPPYYAALALGALLPLATLHEYPGWFILPFSNVLFYRLQHWGEGVGHYWTMAVDEQFYLIWPFLLGLVGQRVSTLLAVALAGLLFRVAWSAWITSNFVLVLLPSCLDMFALGAILRITEHHGRVQQLARGQWVLLAWLGWVGLWGITHLTDAHALWLLTYTSAGSGAAFLTLAWVMRQPAADYDPGNSFLLNPFLQWVGLRSYGCYLYHLLLPVFYQRAVFRLFPLNSPHGADLRAFWLSPLATVAVLTPLLIALAALSWNLLESPLNRWKDRLSYTTSE